MRGQLAKLNDLSFASDRRYALVLLKCRYRNAYTDQHRQGGKKCPSSFEAVLPLLNEACPRRFRDQYQQRFGGASEVVPGPAGARISVVGLNTTDAFKPGLECWSG